MLKRLLIATFLLSLFIAGEALAFRATISSGSRTIYLRVGDGSFNGTLQGGGSPRNNSTINVVSVTVPAASIGDNNPLMMTTDATIARSFWDNYTFCNLPNQLYIGGFYRYPNGSSQPDAILTASWPTNLTTPQGDNIPFSQISWTASGNGDSTTQPQIIPSGSFDASPKTISSWDKNTWNESCHTFFYANSAFVGSGTYTGRVTYTLSLL